MRATAIGDGLTLTQLERECYDDDPPRGCDCCAGEPAVWVDIPRAAGRGRAKISVNPRHTIHKHRLFMIGILASDPRFGKHGTGMERVRKRGLPLFRGHWDLESCDALGHAGHP